MGGYGPGFGMMSGWGGGATFPFSGILGLLVLAIVIAVLIWLAGTILRSHDREPRAGQAGLGLDAPDPALCARGDQP